MLKPRLRPSRKRVPWNTLTDAEKDSIVKQIVERHRASHEEEPHQVSAPRDWETMWYTDETRELCGCGPLPVTTNGRRRWVRCISCDKTWDVSGEEPVLLEETR
jgi:hypothetical protein